MSAKKICASNGFVCVQNNNVNPKCNTDKYNVKYLSGVHMLNV